MEKVYNFESEQKLYSIIGSNIRYYRKLYCINKSDMTQKDLAKLVNVSTSLIGN